LPAKEEKMTEKKKENHDMKSTPVRLLLVESSKTVAAIVQQTLKDEGIIRFDIIHADCLKKALEHLNRARFDIILLNLLLPDSTGLNTIIKIHEQALKIPLIVLTQVNNAAIKDEFIKYGVQDYLVKDWVDTKVLPRSIYYAIERKKAEDELIKHRNHLQELVNDRTIKLEKELTERKKKENELKEMFNTLEESLQKIKKREKELENINENLDSFAYSVSHDLRAPLRAISGFAYILLNNYRDKVDQEMGHYLDRISKGAQEMGQLIDDLLRFSRSTRGEIRFEQIDVDNLVNDMVRAHRDIIEPDRDINFIINPLGKVEADKEMLKVVFANLLLNSVKYTMGRERACIKIGSEQKEDHIQFYIKDNGIGFDMKYKDKLFKAFQRLHTDEKFTGTGIGLATVERIVSKHGGKIWAEGEVDKGATFYFTLPSKTNTED